MLLAVGLAGCVRNAPHRPVAGVCTGTDCSRFSIERQEAATAIGHWPPFWTHELTKARDAPDPAAHGAEVQRTPPEALARQECADRRAFEAQWRPDGFLRPGWSRRYSAGALLRHTGLDPNVPFWMVRADRSVIAGHSDIEETVFVDFIRQLYDELLPEAVACGAASYTGAKP